MNVQVKLVVRISGSGFIFVDVTLFYMLLKNLFMCFIFGHDVDSNIPIDVIADEGDKGVLNDAGAVGAVKIDNEVLNDVDPIGANTESTQYSSAIVEFNADKGDNDLNKAGHTTEEASELLDAAVLISMKYTSDEHNKLEKYGSDDDKDVSNSDSEYNASQDDPGSDSDSEYVIDSDASQVEEVVSENLRGLKGNMVPVLKRKRRGKVPASKKFDLVPVDACIGKVVQKFSDAEKSDVASSSKKRVGKKARGKNLKKKAKLEMADEGAQNLRTTCQFEKFVEVIKHLTAAQIRAVEEIGFGGLLKFNIRGVPKGLVQFLVENLNTTSLVQDVGGERYPVDKNDIYDMFQLPISDLAVVEVSHKGLPKGAVPADDWIRAIWFEKYASKEGVITVKDLYTAIPSLVDDSQMEEFKRVFVMFSLSCFLAPAARSLADMQIVISLQNVDMISSYDWCGYVLKRFCATVTRVKNSNKFSSMNACLIIPLLAFFYRYPVPGVVDPIELPLHQHWDTEKVKKRCDVFRHGGYTTFLRGTQHFPLTNNGKLIGAAPTSKNPSSACPSSSRSSSHGYIELELGDDTLDDEEIERIAKSPLEVARMKFKRLVSIACDQYVQALARISVGEKKT